MKGLVEGLFQRSTGRFKGLCSCNSHCRRLTDVLVELLVASEALEAVRKGDVPLIAGTDDTECEPADNSSMNVWIEPLPPLST